MYAFLEYVWRLSIKGKHVIYDWLPASPQELLSWNRRSPKYYIGSNGMTTHEKAKFTSSECGNEIHVELKANLL